MNKVISINIGGSIFQIEESAFEKLNSYLIELKNHFRSKPEGNEIITDIENRIAEILRSKITPNKAAINIEDVNEVTTSMGSPKDFVNEEETVNPEDKTQGDDQGASFNASGEHQRSRIYRDPEARIVGGVCSGLGHYFKIDPLWIRLFFVIVSITVLKVLFFGFSPVLVYIILWIIIPEAKTTAEKLQMRKVQINIDNIQKSVQTEFNKVKDTLESKDFQVKATSFARKLADFASVIVLGVLNVIRKVAKAFFTFFGIIALVIAISSLTGNLIYHSNPFFEGINIFRFFENKQDYLLAQTTFFLGALGIGLFFLSFAHFLSKNKLRHKTNVIFRTSTILVTIAAFVLGIFVVVKVTSYFATSQTIENQYQLDSTIQHFYLRNLTTETHLNSYSGFRWGDMVGDTLKISDIRIVVVASEGKNGKLIAMKRARGQSGEYARLNAASILALSSVKDSIISLPFTFTLLNNQVYRKQELLYTLEIPLGVKFTLDQGIYSNIKINSNNGDIYAHPGSTYSVTKNGIVCDDCAQSYGSGNIDLSMYPLNIPVFGHQYDKVDVSSSINLKVIQGNEYSIRARGTDNTDDLEIDFEGDQIHISDNRRWNFILSHQRSIDVILIIPSITELKVSGSVDAFVEGFREEALELELSGASSCKANFEIQNLNIEMGGATNLVLDGKIANCKAEINGASKIYASEVPIRNVTLDVSGASFAEVNCIEKLEAEASGASTIKYKGTAKNLIIKNSGASSIERME